MFLKKYYLFFISIIILILSSCSLQEKEYSNQTQFSNVTKTQNVNAEAKKIIEGQEIKNIASIEAIDYKTHHLSFQIKNLTKDKKILNANIEVLTINEANEVIESRLIEVLVDEVNPGEESFKLDYGIFLDDPKTVLKFKDIAFVDEEGNYSSYYSNEDNYTS